MYYKKMYFFINLVNVKITKNKKVLILWGFVDCL